MCPQTLEEERALEEHFSDTINQSLSVSYRSNRFEGITKKKAAVISASESRKKREKRRQRSYEASKNLNIYLKKHSRYIFASRRFRKDSN